MPRITSKLQITIPKRLAEQVGLGPGDEVEFLAAGDGIRMVPAGKARAGALSTPERLRLFQAASERQRARDKAWDKARDKAGEKPGDPARSGGPAGSARGWTRSELYTRAKPR